MGAVAKNGRRFPGKGARIPKFCQEMSASRSLQHGFALGIIRQKLIIIRNFQFVQLILIGSNRENCHDIDPDPVPDQP
ncbi:hypothetical protein TH8_05395 [Thalassospira profundimaris]|nr:hypothetical protein TH8_05395 [Thalassospira profundimaris]